MVIFSEFLGSFNFGFFVYNVVHGNAGNAAVNGATVFLLLTIIVRDYLKK